jgi:RNA polymerase sigma-70 factor, ECF subfamily
VSRRYVESNGRLVVYCLIPAELAEPLHDPLRRYFADDDPGVEVIVERRQRERRGKERRRGEADSAASSDRRLVRSADGRRMAERRATLVHVEPLPLPRRARPYASHVIFVERLEPSGQAAEDIDSNRLLASAQSGDSGAFAVVYMRYFDRLYRFLRLALRDRYEAEDATQQVFVTAWEKLSSYTIDREHPFRAWLFGIARYEVLHRYRKHRLTDVTEPEQISRQLDDELSRAGSGTRQSRFQAAMLDVLSDRDFVALIGHLPLLQRQILILRYLADLRFSEIADLVHHTPASVRQAHHRALRAIEGVVAPIGTSHTSVRRSPVRVLLRQAPVMRSRRFALLASRPVWR